MFLKSYIKEILLSEEAKENNLSDSEKSKSFEEVINQNEELENKTKIIISNNTLPPGMLINSKETAITYFVLGDIIFSHLSGLESFLLPNKNVSNDIRTLAGTAGVSIQMIMSNPNFRSVVSIYNNFKDRISNNNDLKKIAFLYNESLEFLKKSNISSIMLERQNKIKLRRASLVSVIKISKNMYMSDEEINASKIVKLIKTRLI